MENKNVKLNTNTSILAALDLLSLQSGGLPPNFLHWIMNRETMSDGEHVIRPPSILNIPSSVPRTNPFLPLSSQFNIPCFYGLSEYASQHKSEPLHLADYLLDRFTDPEDKIESLRDNKPAFMNVPTHHLRQIMEPMPFLLGRNIIPLFTQKKSTV